MNPIISFNYYILYEFLCLWMKPCARAAACESLCPVFLSSPFVWTDTQMKQNWAPPTPGPLLLLTQSDRKHTQPPSQSLRGFYLGGF